MDPIQKATPAAQKVVMFVIWFAILQGLFIIRLFAMPKADPAQAIQPLELGPISYVAIAGAAISMIIRWVIIPKYASLRPILPSRMQTILPLMIMGIAMAEGCGIIGMFAVPPSHVDERNILFGLSVICVVLSAPIYLLKRPQEPSPYRQS